MLGFWFSQLTTTSAALLAGAVLMLLRASRHSHRAVPSGATRRVRLVSVATLVAVAALALSALLGAPAPAAVLTAAILGGSVLACAPLVHRWAVPGVVTWALAATTAASGAAWALHRTATSPSSPAVVVATGIALLTAALLLLRLRFPAERWVSARAGLVPGDDTEPAVGATVPMLLSGAIVAVAAVGATGVAFTSGGSHHEAQGPASASGDTEPPDGVGSTVTLDRARPTAPPTRTPAPSTSFGANDPATTSPSPTPLVLVEEGLATALTTDLLTTTEAAPVPPATSTPSPAPVSASPEPTKTPGYEKDKPQRPPEAPSPGPDSQP